MKRKSRTRKFLAFLLALAMCASLLPSTVLAATVDETAEGTETDAVMTLAADVDENVEAVVQEEVYGEGDLDVQQEVQEEEPVVQEAVVEETEVLEENAAGDVAVSDEIGEPEAEVPVEEPYVDEEDDAGIMTLAEGVGSGTLDGDYAYLDSVGMATGNSMTTGTAPWDDEEGAGNDTSAEDKVLRTFDTATYTVTMTTHMRDGYEPYKTGNLYFELVVKGTSEEVQWEPGSMGWLESKHGVYTVTEEEYEGSSYQVLRGYVTLEPATDSGHAIGETTQELTMVLRALAMKNEETLKPEFTFFLANNNVGLTADEYAAWGTDNYGGPIVTFAGQVCAEHNEEEYKTVTAPEVTISARPMYNVYLKNGASDFTTVQSFDFTTGNEKAVNKNAKTKYGRLFGYGLALEIVGKNSTSGLRGAEIPKNGDWISATFTLDLTSDYTSGGETYKTDGTKYTLEDNEQDFSAYAPLVWSFEGNSNASSQEDDRNIPITSKYSPLPINRLTGDSNWFRSCYNGGSWTITKTSDGKYKVTIEECVTDMNWLPYTNLGSTEQTYTYYDPNNINYDPSNESKNDYWEVQTAVISTGECWVVQPFYSGEKDENTYIAKILGEGTFTTHLSDSDLEVKASNGNEILGKGDGGTSNQVNTNDDKLNTSLALINEGNIIQHIVYLKDNYTSYSDALTNGCYQNGEDWILQGDKLTLYSVLSFNTAEEGYTGVAEDILIKFDDAFFEPSGEVEKTYTAGGNDANTKVLWAAKLDGSGWNHREEDPNGDEYDTEMIEATEDDLVFYSSLEDLENDNKTCVGVMVESRGLLKEDQNNLRIYVHGTSKSTAETNQVYMISPYARVWNRENLAEAMAKDDPTTYANTDEALNALLSMSDAEVNKLVAKYIPSGVDNGGEYPEIHWINGGRDGNSGNSDNIRNYRKAYYTESGVGPDVT